VETVLDITLDLGSPGGIQNIAGHLSKIGVFEMAKVGTM